MTVTEWESFSMDIYDAAMRLAGLLAGLDPPPDSPSGKFLIALADALAAYERDKFPMLYTTRTPP